MSKPESPRKFLAARAPSVEPDSSLSPVRAKPLSVYALTVSLCAFPLGWDLGTTGNLMDLPSFRARLGVSAQVTGLLISVFNLGCICACTILFMTQATQKFGQLTMFRICLLTFLLGSSLSYCGLIGGASSLYFYSFGRALQGVSAGASCVVGPVFIGHLCTFSNRSITFFALFQILIGVFVLCGNCLFIYTGTHSEHVFNSISVAMPIVALALSTYLPDSPIDPSIFCDPRRLRNTLEKLVEDSQNDDIRASALKVLKARYLEETSHNEKRKIHMRRLAACCLLSFLQQMTGANFFFYFGKAMFDSVIVVNVPVKFSGLLLSLCNLGGTVIFGFLVRWRGSRKLLFTGSITLSILLFTFASMGAASQSSNATQYGIPMLVTSCLFLFVFAMTWGPCTALLSMDISETDERILSCAVICGWITNVLVVSLFPILVEQLGLGAMYIFLVFTIISIWTTRKDYSDIEV